MHPHEHGNDAAAKQPVPATRIYKMYYTFCEDPGCGAINDYADNRADAELNRKRHVAAHRAGDAMPVTDEGSPIPTRRQLEKWAAS